jgi:hypothetical protein
VFEIVNHGEHLDVYDPFELGEHIFSIAQTGDFETANYLTRRLWAFDHKQAKFFRMVARDYCRKHEDHTAPESESGLHHWTGMDHLFHIYMLGWWHSGDDFFDEEDKVFVTRYKNADKATKGKVAKIAGSQVAGYLYSGLVLGVGIAKLNIFITKKINERKKAKANMDEKIVNTPKLELPNTLQPTSLASNVFKDFN